MKKKLLLTFVWLCLLSAPLVAQDDTVVEEIVARVNNAIITRADLRRNVEQAAQEQSSVPASEREANSLRDLIDQQLLVQKATDLGISADADLVKRLDEIRKQMNVSSMEEMQKTAESQGVHWEEYKTNLKNNILTQKVIGSEVGSRIQITQEDVRKYFDEHQSEFTQPERARLSEILIAILPAGSKQEPTPEQIAAAEARANDIYQQLKSGAHFDELARKQSAGATAENGGDLGYFKRGDLAKELEAKAFALQAGQFTEPMRTRQGFIILKLTDHIDAGMPKLDQVHDQIQEQLYSQRIQPALRNYLTKLREDAYIDIKPGYVDSGASPRQTKLVYTSEAGPKTKQVRGRLGIGKKKTVLVEGQDKKSKNEDTTSALGSAKADVDAKERAAQERKSAAEAAAAKAAAETAERDKLSHMSAKERKAYLTAQKKAEKEEAKAQRAAAQEEKNAGKKNVREARQRKQEKQTHHHRYDPTMVVPVQHEAASATRPAAAPVETKTSDELEAERQAAAQAAIDRAKVEADEKAKLDKMSDQERTRYLAAKRREQKKQEKAAKKEKEQQKKAAEAAKPKKKVSWF